MRNILTCWFLSMLLCSYSLQAQKKYALLVGVNEYFDAPGKLYFHSLKGCVNDAVSMRELLVNRFGFEKTDITTLFDGTATKRNLLKGFRSILQKCQPGDVFVFFYSGHGVWMNNDHNHNDRIKKGMSQAIVMSDLYSENWNCLVRDETLKGVMNKFLDKKVTTTAIMDCCYSANLMMSTHFDLFYMDDEERGLPKDFDIRDLPYVSDIKEPMPCKGDSTDIVDSDGDGYWDCMDWEINSPPGNMVDERGICIEVDAGLFYEKTDAVADSFGFNKEGEQNEKAFDISKTVKDTVISVQARPVDRRGGGFVSLAATTEYEKGLEIVDLNGSRHGAFTAALIQLYNNNPADISLSGVITGVNDIMNKQQYRQGPTIFYEKSRENENLIGFKTDREVKRLRVTCIEMKNGTVIINKGKEAGIFIGNRFMVTGRAERSLMQIISVRNDSATGKVVSGKINKKDQLEMVDAQVSTKPRLKVYIPSVPITMAAYDQFMKKSIIPKIKDSLFIGPLQTETYIGAVNFYLQPNKIRSVIPYQFSPSKNYMVFLPFPSYVAEGLKARLSRDQNIELVKDTVSADMMLMMSYDQGWKGQEPKMVICFNTPKIYYNDYLGSIFQPIYITLPDMNLKGAALTKFYSDMQNLVWRYLRKKTTAWLNQYPRK